MNLPTFIKWAGGKRRLISQLEKYFPKEFNTYYEPFLGGGSIFFYVKLTMNPKHCVLSDINQDLINTYIAVRDKPELLMKHLQWFKENHSKEFYYETRTKFNQHKYKQTRRCAAFIYLNKTCFNGIYRVNKKNEFNVPIGRYKDPEIYNRDNILLASKLLQDVTIVCQDYQDILKTVNADDFVYLDPCYDPLKKTSFTEYTPDKFSEDDRYKLNEFIQSLHNKNSFFVLSNNKIEAVRKLYRKILGVHIRTVEAARCVNGTVTGRGRIKEDVIYNTRRIKALTSP